VLLLAWTHPERGASVPREFISSAEADGQIVDIGGLGSRASVAAAGSWRDGRDRIGFLAINIIPHPVQSGAFPPDSPE